MSENLSSSVDGWESCADLPAAAHWYRRCAERGHAWAQYHLATLLFDGRGVEIDRCAAIIWWCRAADQGHARAMNLLARCCEEGWGCARDPLLAYHWYRRYAEAGYFRGQFNYASFLAERGFTSEAAEWFDRAAVSERTDRPGL